MIVARWTHANSGVGVVDQASGSVTNASALAIYNEAIFFSARDADAILVKGVARRTHALFILIQDQASTRRTGLDRSALNRGVTFVSDDALAGHGPDWQGVKDCTDGIDAARVSQGTRISTLAANAGCLTGTIVVGGAANFN